MGALLSARAILYSIPLSPMCICYNWTVLFKMFRILYLHTLNTYNGFSVYGFIAIPDPRHSFRSITRIIFEVKIFKFQGIVYRRHVTKQAKQINYFVIISTYSFDRYLYYLRKKNCFVIILVGNCNYFFFFKLVFVLLRFCRYLLTNLSPIFLIYFCIWKYTMLINSFDLISGIFLNFIFKKNEATSYYFLCSTNSIQTFCLCKPTTVS